MDVKKAIPKDDSEDSGDRKESIEEPDMKDLGLADSCLNSVTH